jgi:putative transposase
MKEFSNHMAEQFRGKVLSAETDRDHIHLLVSLPPNTNISVFVRSIKTQLSREMRKRFPEQIKQYIYGDDTSFWSRSYFIATTGSVSLETVKQYIESQRSEEHQAKKNQQFQKKTLLE